MIISWGVSKIDRYATVGWYFSSRWNKVTRPADVIKVMGFNFYHSFSPINPNIWSCYWVCLLIPMLDPPIEGTVQTWSPSNPSRNTIPSVVSKRDVTIVKYSTGLPVNASWYYSHSLANSTSHVLAVPETHSWVYITLPVAYVNLGGGGTTPAAPVTRGNALHAAPAVPLAVATTQAPQCGTPGNAHKRCSHISTRHWPGRIPVHSYLSGSQEEHLPPFQAWLDINPAEIRAPTPGGVHQYPIPSHQGPPGGWICDALIHAAHPQRQ